MNITPCKLGNGRGDSKVSSADFTLKFFSEKSTLAAILEYANSARRKNGDVMAESQLIEQLDDSNFADFVKEGVILVDFFAEWCGPCRMLGPILKQVADEMAGKAQIAQVDIDKAPGVTSKEEIASVPTLVLYKDGEEVNRIVGLKDADALKRMISAAL